MLAIFARIAVLFYCTFSAVPVAAASAVLSEPNDINLKQIFYSYTLENTTSHALNNVDFFTYAPVKRMAFQRCMGIASSHSNTTQIDDRGNQLLRFSFDTIPPFARKIVSIHADIQQNHGTGWQMEINPSRYLQPARYIEAGHQRIVSTARDLSSFDPLRTAEKIYRFVSEHVRSDGYSSKEYGAVYALERGKGDCTESMYLFMALCRAAGIPARGIGGYTLVRNTVLQPSRYHNWAEFHDGATWRIADPQQKVFAVTQGDYIAMKILHDFPEREEFPFHRSYTGNDRIKIRMNE
jgi:transglutaminase-like putative cysteine protease